MQDFFEAIDLQYLWSEITRIMREPGENTSAALLIVAAAVIVILMVASLVLILILGRRRASTKSTEELAELTYLLSLLDQSEATAGASTVATASPPPLQAPTARGSRAGRWLVGTAVAVVLLAVTTLAVGVTTSSNAVCAACHVTTPHTVEKGETDPHAGTDCVSCHEGPDALGTVTIQVPERLAHFLNGAKKQPDPSSYGIVASSSCNGCHESSVQKTTIDEQRGVRVSHVEPLEAGAECIDCHGVDSGIISSYTVGMSPCLRCHDGEQATAECSVCHIKDVSYATSASTRPEEITGRKIISTPDCGLCHNQPKECDPCHGGVRMPHTEVFAAYGHARKGVQDIWYNGGRACKRCHTPERRPCTSCHPMDPAGGHPNNEWPTLHALTEDKNSCTDCHAGLAYHPNRDFCGLCHDKPYVEQ